MAPKLLDIGELKGPVIVFGGPYSNFQATRALLAETAARGVPATNLICTGDVVGYGGSPAETVEALRDAAVHVVAGNCERQVAAGAEDCGCGFEDGSACDLLSRGWYPHALAATPQAGRAWMANLPDIAIFRSGDRRCAVIHGGMTDIARFIWPVSPEDAFRQEILAIVDAVGYVDMVFAGHSGIAFQRMVDGITWVNAGAIGLPPHDGRTQTRYAVLGETGVTIERLDYDHYAAEDAMASAGLTQGYDRTLVTGIWPSEDILPAALRRGGHPSSASG